MIVSPLPQGMLKPDGTVDVAALQVLLNDLRNAAVTLYGSGTTAQRPRDPFPFQLYYDTSTGQYLYCSVPRNGATPAVWTPLGGGGAGSGTVTSIAATAPIVVAPSPITAAGTVSHANSGVAAATYGDATHWPQLTVNATGHVTGVSNVAAPSASGTVTSVDQAVPVEFTISGNPITASGTLTIGKANENANYAWLGPPSGSPAQPTFRALVANDIPAGTGLSWLWGSGLDGSVHFDGVNTFPFAEGPVANVYNVTRIIHATDCTIDAGVTVHFYDWTNPGHGGGSQIYCTGTFTCNGHLSGDGQGNTINRDQGGQGTPSGVNCIYLYGANGGSGIAGAIGSNGSNRADGLGGNGGPGGASTTPNAGGSGGAATYTDGPSLGPTNQLYSAYAFQSGVIRGIAAVWRQFGGGAGGGAGGGVTVGNHKGGGGGGGGSVIGVFAKFLAGSGSMTADGSPGQVPPTTSNAGAGGGGGGGLVICISTTTPVPFTMTANGGAGGLSGGAGGNGTAGTAGKVISIAVN